MGIYIKGLEVPKDCQYCPCCKWKRNGDGILGCRVKNNYFTEMELCHGEKPSWCPLTEVPEPHGRLIDADALVEMAYKEETNGVTFCVDSAEELEILFDDNAPIVIKGSE